MNLKIFFAIMLSIFLLGSVSAWELSPFADKKVFTDTIDADMSEALKQDFNENYGAIRISKTFLWVETDKIAEYTLTSNSDKCITDCFASGKATLYSEGTLFDNFDVKDMSNRLVELSLSKIYLNVEEVVEVLVPDTYVKVCYASDRNTTSNGEEICHEEVEKYRTEYETIITQKEYKGEILPVGDYSWTIKATKLPEQSLDWAVGIRGITTDEIRENWAPWTAADCYGVGGNIYIDGDYCVHTFNSTGTFNITKTIINATILTVAGGGGGGYDQGGGGGAGGLLYNTSVDITFNTNVTVGAGGIGSNAQSASGARGGNSSFGTTIIAIGGGGGRSRSADTSLTSGGSGGGGAYTPGTSGGTGVSGQGFLGGNTSGGTGGGGGGGSSQAGVAGSGATGGAGGNGTAYSINGTSIYYAGGGGGSDSALTTSLGGGGRGAVGGTPATNGTNGLGGGGGASGGGSTLAGRGGSGVVIVRYMLSETTLITLIAPSDTSYVNNQNLVFSINATPVNVNLTNLTLYIWNSTSSALIKNVTNSTVTNSSIIFNWTIRGLNDGNYSWNVLAYSTNGSIISSWASPNYTFIYDRTAPSISIIYPSNTYINGLESGLNLSLNYTITNTDSSSVCTQNYNGINTTIPCNLNSTFIYVNGINNITIYANDTVGNFNQTTAYWSPGIVVSNITFNNETFETQQEMFMLNFTFPSLLSATGIFTYNGSIYYSNITCVSSNCSAVNTIDIPTLDGKNNQNKSFSWQINAYNGSSVQTFNVASRNQYVKNISMNYCFTAANNVIALNFSSYDEQNRSKLTPFNFDATFEYYKGSGTVKKILNITNSSVDTVLVCITPNTTYQTDAIIAYSFAPNYEYRNWFYQNKSLNTTQEKVKLNQLVTSASTSFILKVQDINVLPVSRVLINAIRCYPGTNEAETAFIARTDENGMTVGNFEAETALYKFNITNYSSTLFSVDTCNPVVPQTTPYTLLFQLSNAYQSPFNNIENATAITSDLYFNSTSGILLFTYADTSNEFDYAEVVVRSLNFSGSGTNLMCQTNSTLSSGILMCNVNASGSYSAYVSVYRNDETLNDQTVFTISSVAQEFGYYGVFLGWFLILICAFMFQYNEIASIFLINVAVIFCNLIGIIDFGYPFITSLIAVSIIVGAVYTR